MMYTAVMAPIIVTVLKFCIFDELNQYVYNLAKLMYLDGTLFLLLISTIYASVPNCIRTVLKYK